MPTIYCKSGGSNTSPYDTWAKAATSLQTALTQAAAGDIVVLKYDGVPSADAEVAGTTTWTFTAGSALICASEDGATAFTPTAQGTGNWIGNSTATRTLILSCAGPVYIYGLTTRSHNGAITWGTGDGHAGNYASCLLWNSITTGSVSHVIGNATNSWVRTVDCEFKHDRTGSPVSTDQYRFIGRVVHENLTITQAATSSSTVAFLDSATSAHCDVSFLNCDLSDMVNPTFVDNNARQAATYRFVQCKLPSGVSMLGTQSTEPTMASAEVYAIDCHSGDTHLDYVYANALGTLTRSASVYFTSGAAGVSWKIDTTANCSFAHPFATPWIDQYHSGTSAITPYIEVLRDGSTTAYTDAEVWGEFSAKVTSGSVLGTAANDRQSVADWSAGTAGASQAAGAGTGSWTGEGGSAWSGKVDSGSSLTPAEVGYLRGRVMFAKASATLYVDPQLRTS